MRINSYTILSEDTTCAVQCPCGQFEPFVSDRHVYRCPSCGRGYRTEFVVYDYEADESDMRHSDSPAINTEEYKEQNRLAAAEMKRRLDAMACGVPVCLAHDDPHYAQQDYIDFVIYGTDCCHVCGDTIYRVLRMSYGERADFIRGLRVKDYMARGRNHCTQCHAQLILEQHKPDCRALARNRLGGLTIATRPVALAPTALQQYQL